MLAASKHAECVFASNLRGSGASSLDGWGCGNCGSGILRPTAATKADMWNEAQSTFHTECATLDCSEVIGSLRCQNMACEFVPCASKCARVPHTHRCDVENGTSHLARCVGHKRR